MQSKAPTVDAYLAELPDDRRESMTRVLEVLRKHLPKGYQESMGFGMVGFGIPLSRFPNTYNGHPLPIAGLASQKQSMSLYLMGVYGDPALAKWFTTEWKKTGKELDMGKSCIRFKKAEDLPLELIAQVLEKVPPERLIALYEDAHASAKRKKPAARTSPTKGKTGGATSSGARTARPRARSAS